MFLGACDAGKTRAGAEWVRAEVEGSEPLQSRRSKRVALVGEALNQARDVIVLREGGILACSSEDRKLVWEAARLRLV